jgi:hypothetical protein
VRKWPNGKPKHGRVCQLAVPLGTVESWWTPAELSRADRRGQWPGSRRGCVSSARCPPWIPVVGLRPFLDWLPTHESYETNDHRYQARFSNTRVSSALSFNASTRRAGTNAANIKATCLIIFNTPL